MARIALAFVLVVLAVAIQGAPASFDDIVEAAKSGNWEKLQAILNSNLAGDPSWKPVDFHSIRDLKPPQGGQVYGEAEYTFQSSSSDFDGQNVKESGGHKIINNNGDVKEYDFKPPVV